MPAGPLAAFRSAREPLTLFCKVLYNDRVTRPRSTQTVLFAVALGLLGDHLVRARLWGSNVTLGLIAVAGTAALLRWERRPGHADNRATWPWLAAAAFAAMWSLRDAPLLLGADLLAALALSSLPLVPAARLTGAGALETLAAPGRAAWHAAVGVFRLAPELGPPARRVLATSRVTSVAGGLLLALPAVLVFGALFASADPVFGAAVSSLINADLRSLASHAVVTGVLSWAIAGYLWALASPPRTYPIRQPQPGLSALAVLTILGAVALVFTAFVATQAGSLFGGEAFIRERTGLTYAEYARRGFFQMIVASGLSLPLVYAAPFVIGGAPEGREGLSLRSLLTLQLGLTALVLLSALWRMGLYVRAYGLTEDRVYGTAVMLWIGATIAVFARTVLRGRPAGAAFGSVVAAALLLGVLNLANPQAFIARYNLAHPGPRGADVAHLARLGADAVPVLVSRLDQVAPERRCALVTELVGRQAAPEGDWRGWSLARARARRALEGIASFARACPGAAAGTN